tara:strand:- start:162 stop:332 length:171 start_codon:yes stop_codon:yes gene_type:complete
MITERTHKPRVYFADIQRKWSQFYLAAAEEMIEGLARHGDGADLIGDNNAPPRKVA